MAKKKDKIKVNDEYGVYHLAVDDMRDFVVSSTKYPFSMQNEMARLYGKRMRAEIKNQIAQNPDLDQSALEEALAGVSFSNPSIANGFMQNGMSMASFYNNVASSIRKNVTNSPVDLSILTSQSVTVPGRRPSTIGQVFPALKNVRTYGQLNNELVGSLAPGIVHNAGKVGAIGDNSLELVNQVFLNTLSRSWQYDPNYNGGSGQFIWHAWKVAKDTIGNFISAGKSERNNQTSLDARLDRADTEADDAGLSPIFGDNSTKSRNPFDFDVADLHQARFKSYYNPNEETHARVLKMVQSSPKFSGMSPEEQRSTALLLTEQLDRMTGSQKGLLADYLENGNSFNFEGLGEVTGSYNPQPEATARPSQKWYETLYNRAIRSTYPMEHDEGVMVKLGPNGKRQVFGRTVDRPIPFQPYPKNKFQTYDAISEMKYLVKNQNTLTGFRLDGQLLMARQFDNQFNMPLGTSFELRQSTIDDLEPVLEQERQAADGIEFDPYDNDFSYTIQNGAVVPTHNDPNLLGARSYDKPNPEDLLGVARKLIDRGTLTGTPGAYPTEAQLATIPIRLKSAIRFAGARDARNAGVGADEIADLPDKREHVADGDLARTQDINYGAATDKLVGQPGEISRVLAAKKPERMTGLSPRLAEASAVTYGATKNAERLDEVVSRYEQQTGHKIPEGMSREEAARRVEAYNKKKVAEEARSSGFIPSSSGPSVPEPDFTGARPVNQRAHSSDVVNAPRGTRGYAENTPRSSRVRGGGDVSLDSLLSDDGNPYVMSRQIAAHGGGAGSPPEPPMPDDLPPGGDEFEPPQSSSARLSSDELKRIWHTNFYQEEGYDFGRLATQFGYFSKRAESDRGSSFEIRLKKGSSPEFIERLKADVLKTASVQAKGDFLGWRTVEDPEGKLPTALYADFGPRKDVTPAHEQVFRAGGAKQGHVLYGAHYDRESLQGQARNYLNLLKKGQPAKFQALVPNDQSPEWYQNFRDAVNEVVGPERIGKDFVWSNLGADTAGAPEGAEIEQLLTRDQYDREFSALQDRMAQHGIGTSSAPEDAGQPSHQPAPTHFDRMSNSRAVQYGRRDFLQSVGAKDVYGLFSQEYTARTGQVAPTYREYMTGMKNLWNEIGKIDTGGMSKEEIGENIGARLEMDPMFSNLPTEQRMLGANTMVRLKQNSQRWGETGADRPQHRISLSDAAARTARSVDPRLVETFRNPVYGEGKFSLDEDGNASYGVFTKDGVQTLDENGVNQAVAWTNKALADAVSGPLPQDANDAAATVQSRISKSIYASKDAMIKKLEGEGLSPVNARRLSEVMEEVTKSFIETVGGNISEAISDQSDARVESRTAKGIKYNATRVKTPEEADDVIKNNPVIAGKLSAMGITSGSAAMSAGGVVVSDAEGGEAYEFGSAGGGRRGGGNIWQTAGKLGQGMYALYMAKRMWQMAAGPVMQEAEKYANEFSDVGKMGFIGSGGGGLMGSEAGYYARNRASELYFNRASAEEFGGFNYIGAGFAASGNQSVGRTWSAARVGAGLVGESVVGSFLLGQVAAGGGALAGVAGTVGAALPAIGLGIAGGLVAGTVGMEIYNAAHPDQKPVTWGSIPEAITKSNLYSTAEARLISQRSGQNVYEYDAWGVATLTNRPSASDVVGAMTASEEALYVGPTEEVARRIDQIENSWTAYQNTTGEDASASKSFLQQYMLLTGRDLTDKKARELGKQVLNMGVGGAGGLEQAAQYARGYGGVEGTERFGELMDEFLGMGELSDRVGALNKAARGSTFGAQFEQYFAPGNSGAAQQIAQEYGILDATSAGKYTEFVRSYTSLNGPISKRTGQNIAKIIQGAGLNQQQSSIYANIAAEAVAYGSDQSMGQIYTQLAGLGLNTYQSSMLQAGVNGDFRALSYMSYQNNTQAMRMFDQSGNSIWETNGRDAIGFLRNLGSGQMTPAVTSAMGQVGAFNQASAILGTSNSEIVNTFLDGGTRGLSWLASEKSYQASMASAGIQVKGVRLQQQYYWGSGSWDNPGEGSAWWLEDRMTDLQNRSQREDFAYQEKSRNLSNQFAIERESQQWQRMGVTQSYNLWQQDFNYQQSLMQRSWTQQDWNYQDQNRELNHGWQMEDLDEAIRYSSGRERRKLVRQRDRAALSYNLEGEQIETTRDRQQQTWAAEDERFEKQKEYTKALNELDIQAFNTNKSQREIMFKMETEQFERSKKEFEERVELEEQQRELSRKFQKDQLDLQLQSAAIQAGAAQAQKEINDAIRKANEAYGDQIGKLELIAKYGDPMVKVLMAMTAFGASASGLDASKITSLIAFLKQIGKTRVPGMMIERPE